MSNRAFLPAVALLVAAGAAACSGAAGASPTPSATGVPSPTTSPTATPTAVIQGIAHPTGSKDVVLRYDSEGGFVMPEAMAARVPFFTLYGDGRIVFVQTAAQAAGGDIGTGLPIRTARLSEEQIQSLLQFALDDGGLAIARDSYRNPGMADVPTAVFTINADNNSRTVSAMGIGHDQQPGPDAVVLDRLATLAERLSDFDQGGSIASDPYVPSAYRGVITDSAGVAGVKAIDWPWPELKVSDFTMPNDPNALQQGTHTLTADQAAALKVDGFQNGIVGGLFVKAPGGKLYSLVLRPLLPDEAS